MFAPRILADHKKDASLLLQQPRLAVDLLRQFASTSVGGSVYLRRWWTTFDEGHALKRYWHSILAGFYFMLLADSQDPLQVVQELGTCFYTMLFTMLLKDA